MTEIASLDPVEVAKLFHEWYERLAPDFGYATREASAVAWDEVPEQNRLLMIATVRAVQHELGDGRDQVHRASHELGAGREDALVARSGTYVPNADIVRAKAIRAKMRIYENDDGAVIVPTLSMRSPELRWLLDTVERQAE